MKNLTWQNPEQLFVAQELINKVKSKCCGIKVIQSKPVIEDVPHAIKMAGLKDTYTPCVLLKKGVTYASMSKIINLPDDELEKAVVFS